MGPDIDLNFADIFLVLSQIHLDDSFGMDFQRADQARLPVTVVRPMTICVNHSCLTDLVIT